MKHSIQRRILSFFAAALVALVGVCALLSFQSTYDLSLTQGRSLGRSGASLTAQIIREAGLDRLEDPANEKLYARVRTRMRSVCKTLSLQYLYLDPVDDNGLRHFVVTVATDDELDYLAAQTRGLGAISETPLAPQELAALQGQESSTTISVDNEFGTVISWITPYFDMGKQVTALIGTDFSAKDYRAFVFKRFITAILPVAAVLALVFLLLFLTMRRRVIAPLRTISQRMVSFDPAQPQAPLEIHSRDEIQQIADAFQQMSGEIRSYLDNIARISAEQAQTKTQMDIARRIQEGMVPGSWHHLGGGVDVTGSMQAARFVGGDFYDCFFLENGSICAAIGDVSGKGVSAALFMAMAKTMLREGLKQGLSPAAAMERVNGELCESNPEGMFVTAFVLVLNPASGELRYANAGHNPPLLLGKKGPDWLECDPGIALGLFEDTGIENGRLKLEPGEGILLYTDGITEAVNGDKAFFGTERLQALFEGPPMGSQEAVNAVKSAVADFVGDLEQFDDMTLLALTRSAGKEEQLSLPVSLQSLDAVKASVLAAAGTGEAGLRALLACDEALTNIVSYSGADQLSFSCRREGQQLLVEFRDNGVPFDPFAQQETPERAFEDLDRGGMGISLIKQSVSSAAWRNEGGYNILNLSFDL